MSETTLVHRVYIKATADAIWTAITDPEWTVRYGYGGVSDYDLRAGGAFRATPTDEFRAEVLAAGYPCPDVIADGEVVEVDPPHLLVQSWRLTMDPGIMDEGARTLTYEIKPLDEGCCSLTVTHELEGAPLTLALVSGANEENGEGGGGGWAWVLDDLKSLLETGTNLAGT
jgi:uncharacterized protein YndB with AHSA1/START domain